MTSPSPRTPRAHCRAGLLVLAVLLVVLAPVTRGPWKGGEQLVANASSPSPSRRLQAWSTEVARAGPEPVAWYSATPPIERRYVRVAPSALLALEIAAFGSSPQPIRLVTLALHLVACWLGFRLLARFLADAEKAAAVVLVVGLHGAAFEVVTWESCQAIVVAATLALVAATLLVDLRSGRRAAMPAGLGVLLACLLAMTSYEAAVVLPLALLLLDRELGRASAARSAGGGWLMPALLGLLPLYAFGWWMVARGSTPDSARGEPLHALAMLAFDFAGYVAKTLLYFPVYERLGAAITVVGVLAAFPAAHLAVRFALRNRAAAIGVALYALFLAPPLLARATISVLNRPTLRQLYLPLLGVGILLALVPGGMTRRRWNAVGALVALAAALNVMVFVRRAPPAGYERLRASVRSALDGVGPRRSILVVGRARCASPYAEHEYRVEYDASGREVIQLLPLDRDGDLPQLDLAGDGTLIARAASGFALGVAAAPPPLPVEARPPPIVTVGTQRAPFGSVEVRGRDGTRIRELAITLDRPLAEHVLLLLRDCEEARRIALPR